MAPLLENLLNGTLEGEMDSHLEGSKREKILADSRADKIIGLYAIQTVSFMKYRVGKTGLWTRRIPSYGLMRFITRQWMRKTVQ